VATADAEYEVVSDEEHLLADQLKGEVSSMDTGGIGPVELAVPTTAEEESVIIPPVLPVSTLPVFESSVLSPPWILLL